MDYQKKYPITQLPGEFVLVQWERGYKYVEVYYRDELMGSVSGAAKLRKGTKFACDQLNTIELKLSEKPVTLDVIIDGYHSPSNVSHPKKELKKSAVFFWMIFVFALIAGFTESVPYRDYAPVFTILIIINVIVCGIYLLAAITVGKGYAWGFYVGFSMFCLMYLLSLLTIFSPGIIVAVAFIFRTAFLVFLIINMKHAARTLRHKRFKNPEREELLDSPVLK